MLVKSVDMLEEYGRGFVVVVEEIDKFADHSSQDLKIISGLVGKK